MNTESSLMRRPRVDTLLAKAFEKPVVTLIAGSGCGKTSAMYSYLQASGVRALWVQLSEADNQPARFWENFICAVGAELRAAADKLRKQEMPTNPADLLRIAGLIADEIMPRYRYALVFDDLHLIENTAVLWFIRAFARSMASGRLERFHASNAVVLISREDCGLESGGLLGDDRIAQVGEQDLIFTKNEAMEFFRFLGVASASAQRQELGAIYSETEGWPFLLNIAGKLLLNRPGSEKYIRGALRHNVSMIIENELFLHNSPEMNKFLAKLSLVNCLAASFISGLENGDSLMRELMQYTSLVRYDVYMNVYHIHHLAGDYLLEQRKLLTAEETQEVYEAAAQWCMEHELKMDAAAYFAKAGDYDAVIGIVYEFPQIIPFDNAALLLELLDSAPAVPETRETFWIQWRARLLLCLGRVDEAIAETQVKIRQLKLLEDTPDKRRLLVSAYYILGSACMLICSGTGNYCFARHFQMAESFLEGSGFAPLGSMRVATAAPYVIQIGQREPGEPERYIEALAQTVPSVAHIMDGCMSGMDDLARAELAYYQADIAGCRQYSMQALFKARENGQYEIENRALFFQLRAGLAAGKYDRIKESLRQLDAQLEVPEFLNRYVRYDIQTGWFYGSIGQKEHIPDWLKSDFSVSHSQTILSNFEDFARTKYFLLEQNYNAMLAMLSSRTGHYDIGRYLFGQIGLAAYRAVGLYNLKKTGEAFEALREAYALAAPNGLDMIFIEMGNQMRTLAAAAQKRRDIGIPAAWLETMQTKAATYAKRVGQVRMKYRLEEGLDGSAQLTQKELDLLSDLSHGLSRTEIAAARGISINTVKMMLQYVYEKLGAENSMDAVRIAAGKGMV